eukprot:PITA_26141
MPDILKACHDEPCSGHFADKRMAYKILSLGYYWPSLFKDTKEYVKRSDSCQRVGKSTLSNEIPLQPQKPKHYSLLLKIQLLFFFMRIFTRFGVPREIVTDQGSQFTSNMMEKLMEEYKIKHRKSTPYHPQANGQVESTNKVIESIITKTVHLHRRDWAERLPEALWTYRTTWRNTTRNSPYELVYGKEVLIPIEFQVKTIKMAVK